MSRLLFVSVLALAGTAEAQPRYQLVRVPMRDGVELATDVWLPMDPSAAPRPVLLRRTPYGRAIDMGTVNGVIGAGYALVSQDTRGRGDSAGEWLPFFPDAEDGADTIQWIAEQPWSNGRVGTYGGSAEGIVQLLALGEAPPALRCAHVTVATGDVYDALYPGGAWRTELTTAWLAALMKTEHEPTLRQHEVLDDFWDPVRLDESEVAGAVPVLMIGGFFDIFERGTPATHSRLAAASDDQFLVMGAWTHGGLGTPTQGELTYPMSATYEDYVADFVIFFDWCLRDGPRPRFAPVRYYVTRLGDAGSATGEWRSADVWPPVSTPVTAYLHADLTLTAVPPGDGDPEVTLAVDPALPIPSSGGGTLTTPAGPFDQATIDGRPDVVTATTPPATADLELIGEVRASIWAASSTDDADVVARLSQLTPDGRVILLSHGIRRARFREGHDAIRPLTPGMPARFDVELGPIAVQLPAGHALRIAIAGTSSPLYEPNPGTSTPIASDAKPTRSELTVFRDAEHPSQVTLPLVAGTFPGPAAPDAGPPGDPDGGPGLETPASEDGGCGCAAPGAAPSRARGLAIWLAAIAAIRRRARPPRRNG